MCLSILPADRIPDVFHYIREKAPVDAVGLEPFLNYVDRTWINGLWDPTKWSVFHKLIRTNNDCEGLHNRWNKMAKGRKGFYWITSVLIQEARRIQWSAQQLQFGSELRERTAASKRKDDQHFRLWDEFQANRLNSFQLMEEGRLLLKRNYFPTFRLVEERED